MTSVPRTLQTVALQSLDAAAPTSAAITATTDHITAAAALLAA